MNINAGFPPLIITNKNDNKDTTTENKDTARYYVSDNLKISQILSTKKETPVITQKEDIDIITSF